MDNGPGSVAIDSIYVSETDEDELNSTAESNPPQPLEPIPVPAQKPTGTPSTNKPSNVPSQPKTQSSARKDSSSTELIPISSQNTGTTAISTQRKNALRTPVVNISAKFQIRIQVNHSESSSSSAASSSSSSSSAPDSRNSSVADPEAAVNAQAAASDVNAQAVRMSEMHIATAASPTLEPLESAQLPDELAAANTPRSNRNLPQLEKLVTRKEATTPASGQKQAPPSAGRKKAKDLATTPASPAPMTPLPSSSHAPTSSSPSFVRAPPCIQTPDKPSKIVLDDAAQRLLNELYGSSWQTPDLMRKCVIRRDTGDADACKTATKPTGISRVQAAVASASTGKPVRSTTRTIADKVAAAGSRERLAAKPAVEASDTRVSHEFSLCELLK